MFVDESGFLLAPHLRKSWSPLGHPSHLVHRTASHHDRLSALAALCLLPDRHTVQTYFRLYPDQSITQNEVVSFLKELCVHFPATRLMRLWDRLGAHRGLFTQAYLRQAPLLEAFHFPPYSPELNPVELLWSYLKKNSMANRVDDEIKDLAKTTRRHTRTLQRRPDLLRSFLSHCNLPIRIKEGQNLRRGH